MIHKAPWPDYLDQPIYHGDRLTHPDGTSFVAVRLNGYEQENDAWRAIYDGDETSVPSRLCLQIGDKGRAVAASQSDELIASARKVLDRLCIRGAVSMSIPVRQDDEDMILSRIISRAAGQGLSDPERAELERLRALINSPQTKDYMSAVVLEAAHQQERWGSEHDAGKSPEDWIFLVGFLLGKGAQAFKAGDTQKGLHHIISSGAAGLNWHRQVTGASGGMRPGIDPTGVTELPPNSP